ncbi:MAG TPA: spore maturation protein [Clostridiales bacterium]|nr:spore maturation protein [Clostridiales bacterium]HBE12998.1 spore maturation protein [Clostridiales bacterium]HCG36385.1 spore maturation protein [Clostridiales bacterium]
MNTLAAYGVPVVLVIAALLLFCDQRPLMEGFFTGAKRGFSTSVSLLPTLVLLLCGIAMLRASGFLDIVAVWLAKPLACLGVPGELLPLFLIRPLSGSGSTAMTSELFSAVSPDSQAGLIASIMLGSSDTMLYTLSVYFGGAGIKKTRYALPAAILTQIFCVGMSCFLVSLFWD